MSRSTHRGTGAITVDLSDLDVLAALIARAEDRAPKEADAALDRVVTQVMADARANAEAVRDTGAMADNLQSDETGLTRRVFSPVREAAFQEYGSPNTGPPNPWLSGPARVGSMRLLGELATAGDLW